MPTAFTMGVRARRIAAAAPPPAAGQLTQAAWRAGSLLTASVGGLGNNELALTSGHHDHRTDEALRITLDGANVSSWASGQSLAGIFQQTASASRPLYEDGIVKFRGATAGNDGANGKWLDGLTATGTVGHRFAINTQALGIAYILFRLPALPTWDVRLFNTGHGTNLFGDENKGFFLTARSVANGSGLRAMRAGNAGGDRRHVTTPALVANEWVAAAMVLNDDRTTPGTSDQVSRLFVKTKPGGTFATMWSATTETFTWGGGTVLAARINRAFRVDSVSAIGNWDLHSFGFDYAPPNSDAPIESNLDKLLARV